MTPSAARGVLEAVFWKPEIRYQIRRIGIVKQGSLSVIVRNEISDRQGTRPIVIEEKRQQRSSLILKNVDYVIEAVIVRRPHATDPLAKYLDQFERRVARGQYHHVPYLGTREFAACFSPLDGEQPDSGLTFDLGTMLFDIAFVESRNRKELWFRVPNQAQPVCGYAHPLFMESASVKRGWLDVPHEKYQELYRLEARRVS
jgi:CRISPR-associated protein Cas5d